MTLQNFIYFIEKIALMYVVSTGTRVGTYVSEELLQSCLTLSDPVELPGSSVHSVIQARILEWVSMPSSTGSSQFRGGTCLSVSCIGRQVLYQQCHLGSPKVGAPINCSCCDDDDDDDGD